MTLEERLSRLNQKLLENDPSRRQVTSVSTEKVHDSLLQASDLTMSQQNYNLLFQESENVDEIMEQATEALSQKEISNMELRKELEELNEKYERQISEEKVQVESLRQQLDSEEIYLEELEKQKEEEEVDYEEAINQLQKEIADCKLEIEEAQNDVVEPEIIQFVQSLRDRLE